MTTQIILLVALCFGLLSLTIIRLLQTKAQAHKKNLRGLNILDKLVSIVKLTQQHRGMQAGFLNGQLNVKSKLLIIEQETIKHYKDIQTLSRQLDPKTYTAIHSEFMQWQRLLDRSGDDADSSFQAHSGLIARLLDSLWDMADDFALTTNPNSKIQALANNLVRTLPELAEAIGQVRALTMQVSNSDRCTPDKKLHLLFALAKIEQDSKKVKQDLSAKSLGQLQNFVDDVRLSIEDKSLSNKNPEIFFQEATANIDTIFSFIQKGFDTIRVELAAKSP